jgi:hypothetical protein
MFAFAPMNGAAMNGGEDERTNLGFEYHACESMRL